MANPLFNWLNQRSAGLLLHPTALPGNLGIGTIGAQAYRLVDFMEEAKLRYWQLCPLGPTGFGDSPYACFSAFAGNPYLIDLEALVTEGLLDTSELNPLRALPQDHVDYGKLYMVFWPIIEKAYTRFKACNASKVADYQPFAAFQKENAFWLTAYSRFMALKGHFKGASWDTWETKYRSSESASKTTLVKKTLVDAIEAQAFYQYIFYGQWRKLKTYANDRGVEIVGDIPIFVAYDSSDVWDNREVFQLNKDGSPKAVAGVPPDYFSEDGQLWGNPLYDWDKLKETGYEFWMQRLKMNFELVDVVRLDHFRGFYDYWSVPADATNARKGTWKDGPRMHFFEAIRDQFPDCKVIAEDLGDIHEGVTKFLNETGLPGMAILQFAFSGSADPSNAYLPHNVGKNMVLYPGTHDNDTTHGWYAQTDPGTQDHVRRYFRVSGEEVAWDFIRAAYASTANIAIIPMQDFMALGKEARFNTPGVGAGNWQWRFSADAFNNLRSNSTSYLGELAHLYGRL